MHREFALGKSFIQHRALGSPNHAVVEKGLGSGRKSSACRTGASGRSVTEAALVGRSGEKNQLSLNRVQEHRGHKQSLVRREHIAHKVDGLMVKTLIIHLFIPSPLIYAIMVGDRL